jgi:hypothetical protein
MCYDIVVMLLQILRYSEVAMKGIYGDLSIRGAKERLEAIYGAKEFLRGSQEETPILYDHFQKQIDELTQEEEELSSYLGSGNGNVENSAYYDDNDYDGEAIAALEAELAHFNDDLKNPFQNGRSNIYETEDEDFRPRLKAEPIPLYLPDVPEQLNPEPENHKPDIDRNRISLYNQNVSTDGETVSDSGEGSESLNKIEEDWYEGEEPGDNVLSYASSASNSASEDNLKAGLETKIDDESGEPYYVKPDGTRIPSKLYYNTDTDSYYYGPDLEYLAELESAKQDDGEGQAGGEPDSGEDSPAQSGTIHTDPDTGESFYIAPDGTWTPLSELDNPPAEEKDYGPSLADVLGAAMLGNDSGGYGYAETDAETGITRYVDTNAKLAPLLSFDDDENLGLINAADNYNKSHAVDDPLYDRVISDPLTGEYFDASELGEAKAAKSHRHRSSLTITTVSKAQTITSTNQRR